tara:strand:+ start:1755 stop:3200 length:1446 start_codon:yes stop_codon:yes gene_type:complete
MKLVIGQIVTNTDPLHQGELLADVPSEGDKGVPVTYTSPIYKTNGGGFLAIPDDGEQVILIKNENNERGKSTYYYHSTIVGPDAIDPAQRNPRVKVLRDQNVDSTLYDENTSNPTKFEFRGANGAIEIQKKFAPRRIQDDITMSHDKGSEVNVGAGGVQIANEDGKAKIVVSDGDLNTNDKGNAANEIEIASTGPVKTYCEGSYIRQTVEEGTDFLIENKSIGVNGLGAFLDPVDGPMLPLRKRGRDLSVKKAETPEDIMSPATEAPTALGNPLEPGFTPRSGNVRVKSNHREIDLVSPGRFGAVNLVTKTAKIRVDNYTGDIEIESLGPDLNTGIGAGKGGVPVSPGRGNIILKSYTGSISLEAPAGTISLNAANVEVNAQANVDVKAVARASVESQTAVVKGGLSAKLQSGGVASVEGLTADVSGRVGASINSPVRSGDFVTFGAKRPIRPVIEPPIPVITLPILPNDYNDGFPGIGAE